MAKKKPGPPPKPSVRKLSASVKVMMTPDDFDLLGRAAQEDGAAGTSTWLRTLGKQRARELGLK